MIYLNKISALYPEKVGRQAHPLRHIQILNPPKGPDWGLFSFCFKGRWQGHAPFGD